MAYVRWSTRIRTECPTCGDTGRVPVPSEEPDLHEVEYTLCNDCTSCWYAFDHIGGYFAMWHNCACGSTERLHDHFEDLKYEDLRNWRAPSDCPNAEFAQSLVQRRYAEWVQECGEDDSDE